MSQKEELLNSIYPTHPQSPSKKYQSLGLRFNPFPRSGTANINGGDLYNERLVPVDEKVRDRILGFIGDALNPNEVDSKDKFISATIIGDYGSGKTQLLMFVRYVLSVVATDAGQRSNPYVIYIDNPGIKLMEFIGSIISRVGEEYFKKFIWLKIIERIEGSEDLRGQLAKYQSRGGALFRDTDPNPYAEENKVSYKQFLNSFTRYINNTRNLKEFNETLRNVFIGVLETETGDGVLAQYFYELISEDYPVNKTWESLTTGGIRQLEKKATEIIRYVVRLIKEQGYTDFFILVDEFEDITEGRLSKAQVDNYVYNLRTLIDQHREWCLLFSMTANALRMLKRVNPPLADRISNRLIRIDALTSHQAEFVIANYLNMARGKQSSDIRPFDPEGVIKLNDLVGGNARRLLKNCYLMIERASSVLDKKGTINAEFVAEHYLHDSV
jgi:Cdc6-like AAA superfamily ATPase